MNKMILSEAGKIAEECWLQIPDHAKNIELGVYVVMPNHIHGILILHGNVDPATHAATRRDKACLVSAYTRTEHENVGRSRI